MNLRARSAGGCRSRPRVGMGTNLRAENDLGKDYTNLKTKKIGLLRCRKRQKNMA